MALTLGQPQSAEGLLVPEPLGLWLGSLSQHLPDAPYYRSGSQAQGGDQDSPGEGSPGEAPGRCDHNRASGCEIRGWSISSEVARGQASCPDVGRSQAGRWQEVGSVQWQREGRRELSLGNVIGRLARGELCTRPLQRAWWRGSRPGTTTYTGWAGGLGDPETGRAGAPWRGGPQLLGFLSPFSQSSGCQRSWGLGRNRQHMSRDRQMRWQS